MSIKRLDAADQRLLQEYFLGAQQPVVPQRLHR